MALGQGQNLVGVQNMAGQIPLFVELSPRISELPSVGSKMGGINVESILAQAPDWVVLFPSASNQKLQEQLQPFGIKTYFLNIEQVASISATLSELGNLLDAREQAQIAVAEFQRILNLVQTRVNAAAQRKRVYFAAGQNFLISHSQAMLQHEMILCAGAQDVVAQVHGGWTAISIEQLLLWDPDIAVISGSSSYTIEQVLQNPQFQALRVVQNKQIYEMPHDKIISWDYPGPDIVLGILWLANLAYPDLFTDIDVKKEITTYYLTIYNLDVSKAME